MRWFLLLVATGVMLYIAYYLDHYTSLRQQVRQIWYPPVTATPTPSTSPPLSGSVDTLSTPIFRPTPVPTSTPTASPTASLIEPILRQIQANDQRGIDDGVVALVNTKIGNSTLSSAEKELLTQALIREGMNRWLGALQPLMQEGQEGQESANKVTAALYLLLREGSTEALRLLDERLRSGESGTRLHALQALARLENAYVKPLHVELLLPTLEELLAQTPATPPPTADNQPLRSAVVAAIQPLLSTLSGAEKTAIENLLRRYPVPTPTPSGRPTPPAAEANDENSVEP